MKLTYQLFDLTKKYPFSISGYTFNKETTVYVRLEQDGIIGYGEAAPGYYFDETMDDFTKYLDDLDMEQFNNPENTIEILDYCDRQAPGKLPSAKAAVDIALHDLKGKILGKPCYSLFDVNPETMPETTFTIGMDTPDIIRKKAADTNGFHRLKVKLGGDNDKTIIEAIRSVTDLPLTIDANQGWTNREKALEMIHWLNERNVLFIEQPMPKNQWDDNAWLTENSPLPTVADEAVLNLNDVPKAKGVYDGINIKLTKCGGIQQGYLMIQKARALGLKIMIGCMTESAVGDLGAAVIAPLCDWVDLDSAWLLSNSPYKTPVLKNGRIQLSNEPGIGVQKV